MYSLGWLKLKKTDYTKYWQGYGAAKLLYMASRNVKWYNHFGKLFGSFSKS